MTLMIQSWCKGDKCDPCKPAENPTTPGGWYCLIKQIVYPDYYGGPSVILATVHVGPNNYTAGDFTTNPYPNAVMIFNVTERNVSSDSNPYYAGYYIANTSTQEDAINAANAVMANAQ